MRINTATPDFSVRSDATKNVDGNLAFKMDGKVELFTRVASCFYNEPKYYDPEAEGTKALIELTQKVAETNPEYVFKLAAYVRNVLNIRTTSIVLFVIASNSKAAMKHGLAKMFAPFIINRADEIAEAIAFQLLLNGGKKAFPNNLRRALAKRMNYFDAYSYAKYNRDGQVKMKDVLQILHPKPSDDEHAKIFKQILEDKLQPAKTWEVEISTKGSTKENWQNIAASMGYMAILRNLRNFLKKEVNMTPILSVIEDKERVKKSKQLPFRFLAALKSIEGQENPFTSKTMTAVAKALQYSVDNVPNMPGTTVIVVDQSGSMDSELSTKSTMKRKDVAHCLAAIANEKSEQSTTITFSENAQIVNLPIGDVLRSVEKLDSNFMGGGTNAEAVFDLMNEKNIRADRIIFISDEIDNIGEASKGFLLYKKRYPEVKLYSMNVAGYGMSQFVPEKNTVKLAGFSEKIFNFIEMAEQDFDEVVKKIEKDWLELVQVKGDKDEQESEKIQPEA